MSTDALSESWLELDRQWQATIAYIAEKVSSLPVSQVIFSLEDWLDFLLNPALSQTMRQDRLHDLQQRFIRRWEIVAMHMMAGDTERLSRQILRESTDITGGQKPYGKDLTRAFRLAMMALQSDAPTAEAVDILPQGDQLYHHLRMMATHRGQYYMPVISYTPLGENEWQVILEELPRMIDVTLSAEGVSLIWLLGTFVRDQSGGLNLKPEINYQRSGQGTRVKPLRLILGTEYHKHGEWLANLNKAVQEHQAKARTGQLMQIPLHPVLVQFLPGQEYVSYDPASLSPVGREISSRVARAAQELRQQRPPIFLETGLIKDESIAPSPPQSPEAPEIEVERLAGPRPASSQPPTIGDWKDDAEMLRQKGQLALGDDRALAKKYLLAAAMLDNSSVDVWMTLTRLAGSEQEKDAFLREAQKVMKRKQK